LHGKVQLDISVSYIEIPEEDANIEETAQFGNKHTHLSLSLSLSLVYIHTTDIWKYICHLLFKESTPDGEKETERETEMDGEVQQNDALPEMKTTETDSPNQGSYIF